MLSENLRRARAASGLSQTELAARLNVVRQTVSKWETGLSVPDAELLIALAEALHTSVGALLGEAVAAPEEEDRVRALSAQLEVVNAQLARQAERTRRIWRGVSVAAGVLALLLLAGHAYTALFPYLLPLTLPDEGTAILGGADGYSGQGTARRAVAAVGGAAGHRRRGRACPDAQARVRRGGAGCGFSAAGRPAWQSGRARGH